MEVQKSRFGLFFALIGLLACIIFYASVQSEKPLYLFFFGGFFFLSIGIFLVWREIKPAGENPRFRTLRSWREKRKQKKKK